MGSTSPTVDWLPEDAPVALPEEFAELVPVLDNVLDQVGGSTPRWNGASTTRPGSAARLAEVLPVPAEHKQHCLELDDPLERLRYLRPMFEIAQS